MIGELTEWRPHQSLYTDEEEEQAIKNAELAAKEQANDDSKEE